MPVDPNGVSPDTDPMTICPPVGLTEADDGEGLAPRAETDARAQWGALALGTPIPLTPTRLPSVEDALLAAQRRQQVRPF